MMSGILTKKGAKRAGEGQLDLRVDLDLIDAGDLILDRILDGHDVALRAVELRQACGQRRGLTASRSVR